MFECVRLWLQSNAMNRNILNSNIYPAVWFAQLVEHQTAGLEVTGLNPGWTVHHGLNITGKIMLDVIKTLSQFR